MTTRFRPPLALLAVPVILSGAKDAGAQPAADTTVRVTFGAFIDTYYAYDFDRPPSLDRAYTTQAARHDEFNVNLAFVEAALTGPRVRGRFAAQFGTAVQANYAAEPTLGTLSGPSVSRFIQEAFLGYRLRDGLWVDAGVFFAPFGAESWISRDNPVYTRSLIADNSPYYESGVRLSWQARPTLQVQAHVINGWQNISETNEDKAVAVRADWTAARTLVLTYDAFVGNEQPDSARSRVRQFHEAIARWAPNGRTTLWATFDYGRQPRARAGAGAASWRGFAVLAHRTLTSRVGVGGRAEGYWDLEQTIVTTPALRPFGAGGGSVNVDVALHPRALWRTELRALSASEWIFPTRRPRGYTDRDGVLVSSLALTF